MSRLSVAFVANLQRLLPLPREQPVESFCCLPDPAGEEELEEGDGQTTDGKEGSEGGGAPWVSQGLAGVPAHPYLLVLAHAATLHSPTAPSHARDCSSTTD
jgi:hypothetical protein